MKACTASRGGTYPDFDFNRFGDYLVRGVWPFLVTLVASLGLGRVMIVPMFLFQILLAASEHRHAGPLAAVVMILMFIGLTVLSCAFYLVLMPLMLRAGLSQDFVKAFDFTFLLDFLRRMWLEMLLAALFLYVSAFVLMIVGFMACCIGVYPAMTLARMPTRTCSINCTNCTGSRRPTHSAQSASRGNR